MRGTLPKLQQKLADKGGHVDIGVGGWDVDVGLSWSLVMMWDGCPYCASLTLGLADVLDADAGAEHLHDQHSQCNRNTRKNIP